MTDVAASLPGGFPSYYCFCGPPSARAIFVSRLGIDLLRAVFGNVQLVYANKAKDLVGQLREQSSSPVLLYFDFPDPVIARVVVEKGIPTVLVSEPFEDIVLYSMAAWGMDLHAAIRFATHSVVALHQIGRSRTINSLQLQGRDLALTELVNLLALSLGIEVSTEALQRLIAPYDNHQPHRVDEIVRRRIEHAEASFDLRSKLSSDERQLLAEIASSYQPMTEGRQPEKISWPGGICLNGDRRDASMSGSVDMTGPARILSFGPYLHLPAGRWAADMRFFVSGNWSRNMIMMEVTAGSRVLAVGQSDLPAVGAFSMRIPFSVEEHETPVEVRSVLRNGAIEGDFRLLEIVVTPDDGQIRRPLQRPGQGSLPGQKTSQSSP